MISLTDVLVVAGLFVLRIGVPLGIILLLGYFLKRLDQRWEEQARRERGEIRPAQPPTERPAVPRPERRPLPGVTPLMGKPCWEIKGCPESAFKRCPAFLHPDMPCWQARFEAEGSMPQACAACAIYERYERYPKM